MLAAQPAPRLRGRGWRGGPGSAGYREEGQAATGGSRWREGGAMPFYLLQIAYTPESFKAMLANPSDRKAAAEKVTAAMGGKVHEFFFAFGKYDAIVIVEAPDDVAVAGAMMAIAATGGFSAGATTKLFTSDEAMEAMKVGAKVAAAGYKPPAG
jgi:uncharacterized protein with GYD domain